MSNGTRAVDEANYKGVYWKDITWNKDIHSLGDNCPCCGIDGGELVGMGHQIFCIYVAMYNPKWNTSKLREEMAQEIKAALEREGKPV